MQTFIYALKDPRENTYFYVGRSHHPKTRLMQHVNEAKSYSELKASDWDWLYSAATHKEVKNEAKLKKISSIIEAELEPVMEILDEWDAPTTQDANRLEDAWIAHFRGLKHKLTNRILSRRMNPAWYSPQRKGWKQGWARSPMEYISMLKDGKINIGKKNYSERKSTDEASKNHYWRIARRRAIKRNKTRKRRKK